MSSRVTTTAPSQTYDAQLLFAVLFLVVVGIIMVYSASSALASERFGSGYHFLKKQALYALLGYVVLLICSRVPFRLYRALTYPLLILSIGLLAAIQVSGWGLQAGGAFRWLRLGPLTFQPVEVARLALIVFMAYSLSKKQALLKQFSLGMFPHVFILIVFSILLLVQPDFGSVVIFGILAWLMMFIGGVPLRHLLASMILVIPLVCFLMIDSPYRWRRLVSFADPWRYASDDGYQITHALMAFGSGGMWGAGIGNGYQKLFYLPEPHTDFIFAVIGEELGLLGVLFILSLFGLIIWRGLRIARRCGDDFGMLLAAGITCAIGLQVSINMGVCLGMLPTKGLTLPFLSYGGTSLLLNMACVGILMNIGNWHAKKSS